MSLTKEQHLQMGRAAIREIQRLRHQLEPRVCFHFAPQRGIDASVLGYGIEASYWPKLERAFAALGIDGWLDGSGGEFGFEIWERGLPTEEWLTQRIPQMLHLEAELQHELQGWTFEPREGPIVNAAPDVGVWNAATSEGQAKIQELIIDVEQGRGALESK